MYSLSLADQELLKDIKWNEKIALVDIAIRKNAALLKRMVAEPETFILGKFTSLDVSADSDGCPRYDQTLPKYIVPLHEESLRTPVM